MIKIKRGTTASWETKNPILENGQPGVERCNDGSTRVKIGDGVTPWNQLSYVSSPDSKLKWTIYN